MSKAVLIFDEFPRSCLECPCKYHAEDFSLGNFTYQRMYRCKFEPTDLDEDEGDIVYLNNIMMDGKPPWCQLKELPKRKPLVAQPFTIPEQLSMMFSQGYNSCLDKLIEEE